MKGAKDYIRLSAPHTEDPAAPLERERESDRESRGDEGCERLHMTQCTSHRK